MSKIPLTTLLLAASAVAAWPQSTEDLLSAPVAKPYIRVRLSTDGKTIEWNVPAPRDTGFQSLPDNQVFVAPGTVSLAYPQFNPLTVKASVSATGAKDPSAALIGDLITSILTVVSQVAEAPEITAAVRQSQTLQNKFSALMAERKPFGKSSNTAEPTLPKHDCADIDASMRNLKDAIYDDGFSKEKSLKKITAWRESINAAFRAHKSGPDALSDGNSAVKTDVEEWKEKITKAKKALDAIQKCAESDVIVPTAAERADRPSDDRPEPPAAGLEKTNHQQYVDRIIAIHNWDLQQKKSDAWETYQNELVLVENRRLAIVVLIANPSRRIAELNAIVKFAEDLSKQLTTMSAATNWRAIDHGGIADDYILLNATKVTRETMQNVSITLIALGYDADSQTGAISLIPATPVAGKLTVRNYSRFAVEPGIGAVFGSFKQPKYTTGTNSSGQTVVTRLPDSTVSINPAVMLNFVCRCGLGAVAPMFQIGAATSKTLPAILLGGGLRLWGLGSGHVAIGGGAMFGWIKDLHDLKEGQKVADLATIEADLRYRSGPKRGAYFVVQYKF